ncbi:MAG: dTMP kinase [Gammaproteobacteria bacterium]
MKHNKPYFITLEGIEGAGKSTAIRFLDTILTEKNIAHRVTREPGGTEIAENIRQILLQPHVEPIAADTELLLMFASRAQHIAQVIQPSLAAGQWVLCDRFTDATYAYQGGGRGIARTRIAELEHCVQGVLKPDFVILLDVSVETGLQRISQRSGGKDRFEQEKIDFFHRVRDEYLSIAQDNPRYVIINAEKSFEMIQVELNNFLDSLL